MKQSEKLDLILRELYKYRQSNQSGFYSTKEILEHLNISIVNNEAWDLGKRLMNEGLVNGTGAIGDMFIEINSYGIDYCEEDSFAYKGSAIISNHYNFHVNESSGVNIVNASTNFSININNDNDTKELLEKIYMGIQVSSEINEELQNEALARLDEIKLFLEKVGKLPTYSVNDFISAIGNVSSIASLIIALKG